MSAAGTQALPATWIPPPDAVLDEDLYRCLVHEKLSAVRMGRSKLDLYLEDKGRFLFQLKDMPIRDSRACTESLTRCPLVRNLEI